MGGEDGEEGLDVAGQRRTDGRLEYRPMGEADAPAQGLDQVVPVEQLDRVGEGPLPDPADGGRPVGHEEDAPPRRPPSPAQAATRRSANVVQLPGGTHVVALEQPPSVPARSVRCP